MRRLDDWIEEAREREKIAASDAESLAQRVRQLTEEAKKSQAETQAAGPSAARLEALTAEAGEAKALRGKVQALERKCELLTALEQDGRLENTALHAVSEARQSSHLASLTESRAYTGIQ